MIMLVQGGKGNRPPDPPKPPRPPAPPLTPGQMDEAHRVITKLLTARPELLRFIHEIATNTSYGQRADRVESVIDVFTGRWRDDEGLATILAAWHGLPRQTRRALARLCEPQPDEYTVPRAIDHFVERLRPEQIADVAASLNGRLATMRGRTPNDGPDDATRARLRVIADALAYMNPEQIAALAPLAAAMIDETPRRIARLRAAVRGLLRDVLTLDDWVSLAVSAVHCIRKGGA